MTEAATVWLADWSDSEDADFREAWQAAGVSVRTIRSAPLGTTVGTRRHRLRSWPAYAGLALRGGLAGRGTPVVAWQPLAGALAALLPGRGRLVVLNPILDEDGGRIQAGVLAALRRADRVLCFSRDAVATAVRLGLDQTQVEFVPLGVRARRDHPLPVGDYLVAAGREARDWPTLVAATRGLDTKVVVVGPAHLDAGPAIEVVPQMRRDELLRLVEGSAGVVVPLLAGTRAAGQLAVLDAMAVGRAVVATSAPGTVDYVTSDRGVLVPPGDPDALRDAIIRLADPEAAASMGAAGLDAARGELSLVRFVRRVEDEARAA